MNAMGIDIGTTTVSLLLMDEDSGAVVASDAVAHGAFIDDDCPEGRVQDPERLWAVVRERYDALVAAHGEPCCVGMTGQMHGMLYVDRRGRAVSPLYTWQDGRGNLPMADGRSCARILRDAGCGAASAGYGLTTHCWLWKHGRVPEDVAKLTTISDYVAMRLTGATEPVLGADMAASWGCFDLRRRAFNVDALRALGLDTGLLPRVENRWAVVGQTPGGAPVTLSLGDNQASVLGSVRGPEGAALINIGTGSQISMGVNRFMDCGGSVELRPCGPEGYICVGSGLCGGRAYAMLERFYREIAGTDAPQYDIMQARAEAFLNEYGLDAAWRVRTTFSGTRDNPDQRGDIAGIGVENFRPGALTLGVIAGMLSELKEALERIEALTGRRAEWLVGSGNGLRRNPLARRVAEAVFGLRLRIPVHREEAAFGAALCALAACGRAGSLEEAQKRIHYLDEQD